MVGRSPRHFPGLRVHFRWLDRIWLLLRYLRFALIRMAPSVVLSGTEPLNPADREPVAAEESEMASK
jgi:hypothetical protein